MEDDKTDPMESDEFKLQLRAAGIILKVGGIVAFPTDTLYGIGVDVFNKGAVERVFLAKGRDRDHGLPVLIGDINELSRVAVDVSPEALTLAQRFWPGALTLVLRRSPDVPEAVSGGAPTVAVRVPAHPVPLHLIQDIGGPIIGTSANHAGGADATTVSEVEEQLGAWLDYVVDAGVAPRGEPSTIVDMTTSRPQILREGALSSAEIFAALEDLPKEDPRDEPQPVG